MDNILEKKLKELNENLKSWTVTKQLSDFITLCYLVSFLKDYQNSKKDVSLGDYIISRNKEIPEGHRLSDTEQSTGSEDVRGQNADRTKIFIHACTLGLITKTTNFYESAVINPVFKTIEQKCNGKYEDTISYQNIIDNQLEKKYFNENDEIFDLFPVMLLYKLLLEMGCLFGDYSIYLEEYYLFVSTAKSYNQYHEILSQIIAYRNCNDKNDFKTALTKIKDNHRFKKFLENLSTIEIGDNKIKLKSNKIDEVSNKIAAFNKIYLKFDKKDYQIFLENNYSIFDIIKIQERKNMNIGKSHNRIIFGAPGTGKSNYLNKEKEIFDGVVERVTFHPNFTYAQFVGTYKPTQGDKKGDIEYKFIPGAFLRVYMSARKDTSKNHLLIIEEINRANVAAVFGDIFQLLDRNGENDDYPFESTYPINPSEDIKKFLGENGVTNDLLSIPENMYIWATMNSADQGVLPMDAAFKRRWDFEYIGINDGEKDSKGNPDMIFLSYTLPISHKVQKEEKLVIEYQPVNWNTIRRAINDKLKEISGVNEDKLLGPYFLSKSLLEKATDIAKGEDNLEKQIICSAFKSKILMYLFEDVVKMNPTDLFNKEIFTGGKPLHYSDLCEKFDEVGLDIFDKDFIKAQ